MTIASFLFVPIFEYIETINESFKIFNRYTNETEIVDLLHHTFLLHANCCNQLIANLEFIKSCSTKGALFLAMGALAYILFQNS